MIVSYLVSVYTRLGLSRLQIDRVVPNLADFLNPDWLKINTDGYMQEGTTKAGASGGSSGMMKVSGFRAFQ